MAGISLNFNGINGASGSYLLPPMTPGELVRIATNESFDHKHLQELDERFRRGHRGHRAVKEGVDPKDLSQAGWGVIFAYADRGSMAAIKDALAPLLALRREQSGDLYREFAGVDAFRPGEAKTQFLARHGAGPGPADPQRVPYYLLIVAGPEAIPYSFQYQLDVQYAVGRIHFDRLEDYAQYARSVVAVETGRFSLPRRAKFFGVQNPDDPATKQSTSHLVVPLTERMAEDQKKNGWDVGSVVGDQANKSALASLLGGNQTPALLFTSSHGMGFPSQDPRQIPHQGALLCQDWPGPAAWDRPIPEEHYFSADDLAADSRLLGQITFHFACYSAGTPRLDDFNHLALQEPVEIAPHAFVSQLPKRLLSHPKGGALAVIGHVERAWGFSFQWDRAGEQLAVFESTLKRLMEGHPVGSAFEYFNARYAELSTVLSDELRGLRFGKTPDELWLAGMWTANNDARSYVIIGDPAVRLHVGEGAHQGMVVSAILSNLQEESPAATQPESAPAESVAVSTPRSEEASATGYTGDQASPQSRQFQEITIQSLQRLAARMSAALESAIDDDHSLEVHTYIGDNASEGSAAQPENAQLFASTTVKFHGETQLFIPSNEAELDGAHWAAHADAVKQAQSHHAEMIKSYASATASLLQALKILQK